MVTKITSATFSGTHLSPLLGWFAIFLQTHIYICNLHGLSCQEKLSRFSMLFIPHNGTSLAVSHWKLRMVLMVEYRSSRLNQNKPFSEPVSTLLSSSAEFYSFSLSGRLRAVGLIALIMCHNSLYTINWQLGVWRGYGINRLINEYLFSCTILWRFFVLTRKTLNLNVSLSLQFKASLCYFWSFNLIATKESFFSDCISGDVSALALIFITYMMWVC